MNIDAIHADTTAIEFLLNTATDPCMSIAAPRLFNWKEQRLLTIIAHLALLSSESDPRLLFVDECELLESGDGTPGAILTAKATLEHACVFQVLEIERIVNIVHVLRQPVHPGLPTTAGTDQLLLLPRAVPCS